MAELSPPRPQDGENGAARLLLDAWRREADAWGKRLERSDDAAGGLLTACLTGGVVAAAAAGYVKDASTTATTGPVLLDVLTNPEEIALPPKVRPGDA